MLEARALLKIYKPKKGVPVTALNKVSVKFPDKGMVFLLGKSGSGKSTLLNLLGGLDSYESGEIIIKGVSSKDFKQGHFDSYRNTYVGFIFQEYNILEEFTVGANIALAIELQGRKATDEDINEILKEVDLEGYGNRKPNELSGGQKQRVAIARALVKKPEIIMADEPTGALDSNTGKAIFDTLKKLSRDKLVIVVSHDREFAELYADRIIELADGSIISDVELLDGSDEVAPNGISFSESTVDVPQGYHLTEADRKAINDYIDSLDSGLSIKVNKRAVGKHFVKTDESKIKAKDGSSFKLIKSKLPLKNAFKIGAGGLKYKKFRLVMTVLLSCIAFGLFGVADTFAAYNHIETCTNSLYDSDINYISVQKAKKAPDDNGYRNWGYKLSNADLKAFSENTGIGAYGVFSFDSEELSINSIDTTVKLTDAYDIFVPKLTGYGTVNEKIAKELGFTLLAGKYPNGQKDEIAISEYIFEIFKKAKYTDSVLKQNSDGVMSLNYTEIKDYNDIIGKKISLSGKEFKVTAVIDTNLDIERYISLTEENENASNSDRLVDSILYTEFECARSYSYAAVAMVGDGYVERLVKSRPVVASITEGDIWISNDKMEVYPQSLVRLSDVDSKRIEWVNGEKTELADNQIIVSLNTFGFLDQPQDYMLTDGFDYKSFLKDFGKMDGIVYTYGEEVVEKKYEIVGYIESGEGAIEYSGAMVCSDSLFNKMTDGIDGIYTFAIGSKPQNKAELKDVVSYCYNEDSDSRYPIQNPITFELDSVNEFLVDFAKVFTYIGLGFAVFAGIMLANFIATSITYKKQEIGILRAIGSRSNDVFRIFFSESFVIAMINFVLSAIGVAVVTNIINGIVKNDLGILITVLSFSVRQVVLLLAVSILVAFLASFFPVKKLASKKPIDAIRDR